MASHDNIYHQHSPLVSSCIKTLRSVRYRQILNKAPSEFALHRFFEPRRSIARRMSTKLPIEVLSLPFAMTFNVWHLAEASLTVRTWLGKAPSAVSRYPHELATKIVDGRSRLSHRATMAYKCYPGRACRNLTFDSRRNYTPTPTRCMLKHAVAPIKKSMVAPWTRTRLTRLTCEGLLQHSGGPNSLLRSARNDSKPTIRIGKEAAYFSPHEAVTCDCVFRSMYNTI